MIKVLFVGLGSIGCRHIKNLANIMNERKETYIFEALRFSNSILDNEITGLLTNTYRKYEELPNDYDIVFITNPTINHFESIKKLISKTQNMFIEKPIFEKSDYDIKSLDFLKDGVYYVACPLRYSCVYEKMFEYAQTKNIYSVRTICSTYLPDWRPNLDYRNVYSAKRELGGGVGIDLIHEWDYLITMFGFPIRQNVIKGTYSNLELHSDDLYISIAEYEDKLLELHLDYFGRTPKRFLEFYTDEDTIIGDFIHNNIKFEKKGTIEKFSDNANAYHYKELEAFLDMCKKRKSNINSVEHSLNVLKVAEGLFGDEK